MRYKTTASYRNSKHPGLPGATMPTCIPRPSPVGEIRGKVNVHPVGGNCYLAVFESPSTGGIFYFVKLRSINLDEKRAHGILHQYSLTFIYFTIFNSSAFRGFNNGHNESNTSLQTRRKFRTRRAPNPRARTQSGAYQGRSLWHMSQRCTGKRRALARPAISSCPRP